VFHDIGHKRGSSTQLYRSFRRLLILLQIPQHVLHSTHNQRRNPTIWYKCRSTLLVTVTLKESYCFKDEGATIVWAFGDMAFGVQRQRPTRLECSATKQETRGRREWFRRPAAAKPVLTAKKQWTGGHSSVQPPGGAFIVGSTLPSRPTLAHSNAGSLSEIDLCV
jgi:hypothetical protein